MDKLKQLIKEVLSEKKVKRDRCLRIADRKFDKPSAYKSGAVVRCRQGKIWKGIKEEQKPSEELFNQAIQDIKPIIPQISHDIIHRKNLEHNEENMVKINKELLKKVYAGDDYILNRLWDLAGNSLLRNAVNIITAYTANKLNEAKKETIHTWFKRQDPKGKIWKGVKEDKQLGEAKQVGTIYHYTTFNNGLEILQSNQLKGSETEGHTNTNPIYGLSFTRDKRFHNNHNIGFDASVFGQKPQVRFTIDGDKLSNKYKIQPYAQIGGSGRFEKGQEEFESEERVIFYKPFSIPLLPYLKSIDILIEYKKPKYDDFIDDDSYYYRTYTPLRAKIIKFAQDNNIPINLIINKNGDPYPDKIKQTLIQKILKYFQTNEDESLHKWFKRQGPKGKEGGWVDCNAPDGKGGYKACGRKEGEKRSKYPACRPTPAGCKKKGKGKTWGKTK